MKGRLKPNQQAVLDRMQAGEHVVLDKTTTATHAYWRLTLKPVKLSILRALRNRGHIRLYATRARGITIWEAGVPAEESRRAA